MTLSNDDWGLTESGAGFGVPLRHGSQQWQTSAESTEIRKSSIPANNENWERLAPHDPGSIRAAKQLAAGPAKKKKTRKRAAAKQVTMIATDLSSGIPHDNLSVCGYFDMAGTIAGAEHGMVGELAEQMIVPIALAVLRNEQVTSTELLRKFAGWSDSIDFHLGVLVENGEEPAEAMQDKWTAAMKSALV